MGHSLYKAALQAAAGELGVARRAKDELASERHALQVQTAHTLAGLREQAMAQGLMRGFADPGSGRGRTRGGGAARGRHAGESDTLSRNAHDLELARAQTAAGATTSFPTSAPASVAEMGETRPSAARVW
jgi:hypothetical protein